MLTPPQRTKQTGWKRHEWGVVAQVPFDATDAGDIREVDICDACGKFRLHLRDGSDKVVRRRPELPAAYWL